MKIKTVLRRAVAGALVFSGIHLAFDLMVLGGWNSRGLNNLMSILLDEQGGNVYAVRLLGVFLAGILNGWLRAPIQWWILGMLIFPTCTLGLAFLEFQSRDPVAGFSYLGFGLVAPALPTAMWWLVTSGKRRA